MVQEQDFTKAQRNVLRPGIQEFKNGGVIGIDVCYDPTDNEVPLTISDEYIKHVFETDTEDLC